MAKLLKLHISGIRSFGQYEDQAQQLKFTIPLTLILGQNGCGKTTIIEALNFACSGSVPGGTSSGQGFINDPKMSRSTSTKGQVKLKIEDPRGNEVTICRVAEVCQRSANLKFTMKSSTIRVVDEAGKDCSGSGRCVDVTNECCQIMNVSSSVLSNVIFCHQENSAWPLDEGKKLKEKFDEIFDAQKYNKCTDVLRAKHKAMLAKVKVLEKEVLWKEDKKKAVDKQHRLLQEKENRLETYEEDIRLKGEELNPMKQRLNEILELEHSLNDLQIQLTKTQATKDGVIGEQATIKKSITFEFEGSDEELQNKIKSFEDNRRKEEDTIVQLEKRKSDIEDVAQGISKVLEELQTQMGQFNQEKIQFQKRCAERRKLIMTATEKMDVKLEKDWDDNDNVKYVLQEFKSVLESSQANLKRLSEDKDAEEAKLQKGIDEIRENVTRTKADIESKTKQIKEFQQKVNDSNSELMNYSTSDDMLKNYTNKIDQIDKTIYNLKNTFKQTEEIQKRDAYKKSIQANEDNLESLEAECKILRQNDIVEGKMESEKHLIMEKQRDINKIKSKHSENFKKLFGDKVPERNLKESVSDLHIKADVAVKNLTEKINKKQNSVTTLEVQHQHQLDKVAACEKELKEKQKKISQACNGKNFNETLDISFQKKEKLRTDKGQYSSIKVIFAQFIKEFEKQCPCCPVCETNFSQKGDLVKKIITTLKSKVQSVPQKLTSIEDELKKEETRYDELQQLKLINNEIESLQSDTLPQLQKKLEEISENLKRDKTELESLKTQLLDPQKKFDISKSLISDVASLDQNLSDVEKCEKNLDNLKMELVQVASEKSKEEVEAEIDVVKSELNSLRTKAEAQDKKLNNHRDRLQQLTTERSTAVEKQSLLKDSIQNKPALEAQKSEFLDKIGTLSDDIVDLRSLLSLMEAELESASENKKSVVEGNKNTIEEERLKLASHEKLIQDMEKLQKEIDVYIENAVDEKLSVTEEKRKACKTKEETLEQTKTKIIKLISKKKEELAKQELNFQSLKGNVILREKKNIEATLESEIQALKKRIGGYNYATVHEEKRRLTLQRDDLEKQINNLNGEKKELSTTIEEMRQELDRPENKKAHMNYMSKYYEKKIEEIASDDLLKYITALEKAVLDFHKTKMIQINKNIRELWRDIYRGNDVDYIEIETEHPTGKNATRRSYNYKVVQVKKGIKLDMRGRCSAGQKVLACLIIRMALAESLSANCGILALDEPTTNLDRENIQSLADTLSRIVNMRQRERNFQLLIITHDEEFLNILTRVQGISHFYRIERDNEGFSCIKKEQAV